MKPNSSPSFPLWSDPAPGALGTADHDIPSITPYLPDPAKATGAAIVVFPGGGCWILAPHEDEGYAQWLADQGITAFVVKYRLRAHNYHYPVIRQDAFRAMRLVRARAGEWKIDPDRIGVMGSSAGGSLSALVLTRHDSGDPKSTDPVERHSSRPDLGILCYAGLVVKMAANPTAEQLESFRKFHDGELTQESCDFLSNEKHVTEKTPPSFIWQTWEDHGIGLDSPLLFASALGRKGVPFELHIYEKGEHGIGLGGTHPGPYHRWSDDCLAWLQERGFAR